MLSPRKPSEHPFHHGSFEGSLGIFLFDPLESLLGFLKGCYPISTPSNKINRNQYCRVLIGNTLLYLPSNRQLIRLYREFYKLLTLNFKQHYGKALQFEVHIIKENSLILSLKVFWIVWKCLKHFLGGSFEKIFSSTALGTGIKLKSSIFDSSKF